MDGNKRLGWLATAVFLELHGIEPTTIPNHDVHALVMNVAAGDNNDVDHLGRELQRLVTRQR